VHSGTFLKAICIAASAVVGIGGITCARAADTAAASQPVTFDIKPQPLASALNAFAVQSHQQILFTPEVAAGKTSLASRETSAQTPHSLDVGWHRSCILEIRRRYDLG